MLQIVEFLFSQYAQVRTKRMVVKWTCMFTWIANFQIYARGFLGIFFLQHYPKQSSLTPPLFVQIWFISCFTFEVSKPYFWLSQTLTSLKKPGGDEGHRLCNFYVPLIWPILMWVSHYLCQYGRTLVYHS